jgi:hypothetical protein
MIQPSFKKILIALAILLVLSRTGKILEFFSDFDGDGILTLQPLRESPEDARFLITIALCALIFVTIFCLLNQRK